MAELADLGAPTRDDAPTLDAAATDLGHLVHHRPRAVVAPTSPDEVLAAVRFCAAHRLPLAVRGAGHTTFGQSQAAAGLVLDLANLRATTWTSPDTLRVGAGARWADAVAAALARGRTFAVLPDYLHLSVGGTLTFGGVGESSFLHGPQTDHLVALDLVTGQGEHLRASPTEHPELFDVTRAGLAQCAVVLAAELRTVPAPSAMRVFTLRLASSTALLAAHRHLAALGFTHLQGSVDPAPNGAHVFTLNASLPADAPAPLDALAPIDTLEGRLPGPAPLTLAYRDFLHRLDNLEHAMRELGVWHLPHPWAFLVLPASHAVAFLDAVRAAFRKPTDGRILVYLLDRARAATPLFRLPANGDEKSFMFGLLHNVTPPTRAADVLASNAALWRATAAVGGHVYPAGAIPFSPDDWRRQLGPRLHDALGAAKARFDPAGILAPGLALSPRR